MAFQMFMLIGLGVWLGKKLDTYLELESSLGTAGGAILGLVLAFYLILKDL